MLKTNVTIALVALLSLAVGQAKATLLAYEGFDYTANTAVVDANGGTGWTGAWTVSATNGSQTVLSPTLSEGGATGIGNRLSVTANGSTTSNASRVIFSSMKNSGTYWLSVMVKNDAGNSTTYGYLQLGDQYSNVPVRVGYSNGGNWYIQSPNNSNVKADTGIAATSALLVLKIDLTNKTLDLWVNPSSASDTADGSVALHPTSSYVRFDRLSIRVGSSSSGTSTGSFDEIRIGESYADVVIPEPATLSLLVVGGALAMLRRRR